MNSEKTSTIARQVDDAVALNQRLADATAQDIIEFAFREYPRCAIAFSGAEDVTLIEMALKVAPKDKIEVFCLDSGRLHAQTYKFIDQVREHYAIDIEILFPDREKVENLVREKGLFSFYRDGHRECCSIRKVEPLRRKLHELDAWISGQRRDQSPGTRSSLHAIEDDSANAADGARLIKFNPLCNWSSQEVWDYIRSFDVPYNALHERGFVSIGCEPCTRPIRPGQHEREGRWWWEEATQKECGLHQASGK